MRYASWLVKDRTGIAYQIPLTLSLSLFLHSFDHLVRARATFCPVPPSLSFFLSLPHDLQNFKLRLKRDREHDVPLSTSLGHQPLFRSSHRCFRRSTQTDDATAVRQLGIGSGVTARCKHGAKPSSPLPPSHRIHFYPPSFEPRRQGFRFTSCHGPTHVNGGVDRVLSASPRDTTPLF